MGFGTLFIGYFLLLNLTYYGFTDLIAGLIMLMAFYKLRTENKYFSLAVMPAALFALVGIPELIEALANLFGANHYAIIDYTAAPRYLIIGMISALMLKGIERVAREVDAMKTALGAKYSLPFVYVIFGACVLLEIPALTSFIPNGALAIIGTVLILGAFVMLIANLVNIYSAYRWICMPEDVDNDAKNEPSRFGFVNKFREHEIEKNREYAEYKLEKMKNKSSKKKRKK